MRRLRLVITTPDVTVHGVGYAVDTGTFAILAVQTLVHRLILIRVARVF